jgi:uncharacterized phage infection (PIP) family protein YhgE
MKTRYLYILFVLFFGCTNPSMENGFKKLNQSLSELVAAFDAVNIPQITSDLDQMIKDLESIANGIQDYQDAVDQYNNHIAFYNEAILEYNDAMLEYEEARLANQEFLDQIENVMNNMIDSLQELQRLHEEGNQWAGIFLQIAQIRIGLQDILATMQTKATKEQVEQLLAAVQEMGEGVDQLVAVADYDYDGVVNALDLCPKTPLTKINMVNSSGCAPGETPVSETTTSTTDD